MSLVSSLHGQTRGSCMLLPPSCSGDRAELHLGQVGTRWLVSNTVLVLVRACLLVMSQVRDQQYLRAR